MRGSYRPSFALLCALAACAAPVDEDGLGELDVVVEAEDEISAVSCAVAPRRLCASGSGSVWGTALRVGATATSQSDVVQVFTTDASGLLDSVTVKLRVLRPSPGATAGISLGVFAAPGGVLPDVLTEAPLASGSVLLSAISTAGEGETIVPLRGAGNARVTLAAGTYALVFLVRDRPATGTILVGIGAHASEAHAGGSAMRRARRGEASETTFAAGPFRVPEGLSDVSFRFDFPLELASGAGGVRSWSDGSVAASCDAYRHPPAGAIYAGATGTGSYTISPTGTPFTAYCDMDFDGGGWTLFLSTRNDGTAWATGLPTPNTARYLDFTYTQALANAGSQVHIRSTGFTATRSVTSVANTTPITNLRAGRDLRGLVSDWTGPYATVGYLGYSCGEARPYPNLYWACGSNPGGGLHLMPNTSEWTWTAADEAMEVYVR